MARPTGINQSAEAQRFLCKEAKEPSVGLYGLYFKPRLGEKLKIPIRCKSPIKDIRLLVQMTT